MPKPKPSSSSSTLLPKGKKIVFSDTVELDQQEQSEASHSGSVEDDESMSEGSQDDDDDEPEMVDSKVRKDAEREEEERMNRESEAARLARKSRSSKIQQQKAVMSRKGKSKAVEQEEASGSDEESEFDSEEGSSGEEDEEDGESDDHGSGDDSDVDSEDLGELPTDPESLRLQARMQAAMEAAEREAGSDSDSQGDTRDAPVSSATALGKASKAADDDSAFDLAPRPIPMSVLKKAEEARSRALKRKAEDAAQVQGVKRVRRKQKAKEMTARTVNSKTSIHLLGATGSAAMPPPISARTSLTTPKSSAEVFRKRAMKSSGANLSAKGAGRKPAQIAMARGTGTPVSQFATQ